MKISREIILCHMIYIRLIELMPSVEKMSVWGKCISDKLKKNNPFHKIKNRLKLYTR